MSILDQDVSNEARESVERILDKIEDIIPELREQEMEFDFDMEFGQQEEMEIGGYQKIITYTLATENGASLRASGWQCAPGLRGGGNWNVPGRPRADSRNTGPKRLYYKELR